MRIEQVETAELKPGSPVVGSGGEVAAQQTDGLSSLSGPLEGRGPRRHVGVYRSLPAQLSCQYRSKGERGRTLGPEAKHRVNSFC